MVSTLGIERKTVAGYIDHPERSGVIRRVPRLCRKPRTEISKMAELFFATPGPRNATLGTLAPPSSRVDAAPVRGGNRCRLLMACLEREAKEISPPGRHVSERSRANC